MPHILTFLAHWRLTCDVKVSVFKYPLKPLKTQCASCGKYYIYLTDKLKTAINTVNKIRLSP